MSGLDGVEEWVPPALQTPQGWLLESLVVLVTWHLDLKDVERPREMAEMEKGLRIS